MGTIKEIVLFAGKICDGLKCEQDCQLGTKQSIDQWHILYSVTQNHVRYTGIASLGASVCFMGTPRLCVEIEEPDKYFRM